MIGTNNRNKQQKWRIKKQKKTKSRYRAVRHPDGLSHPPSNSRFTQMVQLNELLGNWSLCSSTTDAESVVQAPADQRQRAIKAGAHSVTQIPREHRHDAAQKGTVEAGKNTVAAIKQQQQQQLKRPESVHSLAFSLRSTASQLTTRSRPVLKAQTPSEQKLVIGYYTFPADLSDAKKPLLPQYIPVERLTHLNYGMPLDTPFDLLFIDVILIPITSICKNRRGRNPDCRQS